MTKRDRILDDLCGLLGLLGAEFRRLVGLLSLLMEAALIFMSGYLAWRVLHPVHPGTMNVADAFLAVFCMLALIYIRLARR